MTLILILKLPKSVCADLEEEPLPGTIDYDQDLKVIMEKLGFGKGDEVRKAETVFRWFAEHENAQYFTDESDRHYIYVNRKLIPIDEYSSDFQALLPWL